MNWNHVYYFKPHEFDSPDQPGSGDDAMDPEFIHKLDKIRSALGRPMKITSGYRTWAHNRKVGGKPESAHLTGFAVDIAVNTSTGRIELVKAALDHGIHRIGIAPTFVHLDTHPTLPQGVLWLY